MKNIIIIFSMLLVGGCGLFVVSKLLPEKTVSEAEFRERINKVELKVDSISLKVDELQVNVDSLKQITRETRTNTDTLKKGQQVIYNEVQKTNESWFTRLKKYFE